MAQAALLKRPLPDPQARDLAVPSGMRREGFRAMGTTISLLLPAEHAEPGAGAIAGLFTEWEEVLSRFRPESELSYLNRHAGEPVTVSALLFDVTAAALKAARATNGIYDPTLLQQMVRLGYDRSFDDLPEQAPVMISMPGPGGGWRGIVLDAEHRRVMLPAGIGLDFGGIAKGMAVDAALARLQTLNIDSALVNAGGDLAVLGLPPSGDAWPIAAQGWDMQWTIPLRQGAMATSGIDRRHWRQGPHQRHHLLDPRTGMPVRNGMWSVTAVGARCAQAEVAAKAAFVLGAAGGVRFLEDQGLAGLVVLKDGSRQTAGGWPVAARDVSR